MIVAIRATAEAWIENHRIAGTPTICATGVGACDCVNDGGHLPPSTAERKSSLFMEGFSFTVARTEFSDGE